MALTVEDYKKKLAELKTSKGKDDKDFMKWEKGPNIGRILPGHPNMEAFYEEVKEHKKGEGKDFISVVCVGDDCEICPELEAYRKSKDKEDQKIWKEQQPKSKFYFNFLSKGPDGKAKEPELKVVGCGTQILQGILGLLCDEEYGESIIDAFDGRDVNVEMGIAKNQQIEYTVKPRVNKGPAIKDVAKLQELIGESEEDSKLNDLTTMHEQFDDPHKAYIVWTEGWAALKEEGDEDEKPKSKDSKKAPLSPLHAVAAKRAKEEATREKGKKAPPPEDDEEEESDTPAITSYPKLKSRCSVCGDQRHKTPNGNLCPAGHKAEPLAEGERPSKPSKAYLKAFPAPVEDEDEEVEEEPEEEVEEADDSGEDEDLGDLDSILKAHKKGKK